MAAAGRETAVVARGLAVRAARGWGVTVAEVRDWAAAGRETAVVARGSEVRAGAVPGGR